MINSAEGSKCCCGSAKQMAVCNKASKSKTTVRSVLSMLLSILIAFFPKCPLCWAVYMSMFGSLGLAKLPYMGWLLPVLVVFLAIHMYMLYKKAIRIGYVPFFISLFGTLTILFTRTFCPAEKWLLITGMAFIISGSLLNSFAGNRLQLLTNKSFRILRS